MENPLKPIYEEYSRDIANKVLLKCMEKHIRPTDNLSHEDKNRMDACMNNYLLAISLAGGEWLNCLEEQEKD